MNGPLFARLTRFRPRQFLPENLDLGDWPAVQPFFEALEKESEQIKSPGDLEAWLLKGSELSAALDEESSRRYIAMTCQTDNPEAEKAYLHYVEQVDPQTKPRQFKLAQIYLNHPLRPSLPAGRYQVFDRQTKIHVELFRPENIPLETEEARIGQQYQKLSGGLTVQFKSEERTLIQMARYLEEPDRAMRQEAWELIANRRLQEAEKFEVLFDQLLKVREQIARNAGFPDYREYAFRAKGRFDYGPGECLQFHETVERLIVPLLKKLQLERKKNLGLDSLRTWDLSVDPLNRAPLRPFQNESELIAGTGEIMSRLDPDLNADFRKMRDLELLDLDNRKGKAPGGYQSTLAESRLPFIFMNAVGLQRDLETLLHEAGHAFHALAAQSEDFYPYRSAPIEFCEVASMTMELLGNQFLEVFYAPAEADRARRSHLERIIEVFPWIATIDAFQHWIYTHPGHDISQRREAWLNLMDRFGGDVDWSGYEQMRATIWHRQLHVFLYPFYYIEYGIAQLGALQIWANARRNPAQALQRYKEGLKLGGSRPLPELFEASGCRFDFSADTVGPLMDQLESVLNPGSTEMAPQQTPS